MTGLQYRIATQGWEFEAIHRLNYATFVTEIPQHPPNREQRLVDRFHAENTYAVCVDGERLVGMVAARTQRPFSLDGKLAELDAWLPEGCHPVELRLLAVEPARRRTAVFTRLAATIARHALAQGCDLALISGTTRQLALYRHLGFVPFGPRVGSEAALFQPMRLPLERFLRHGQALLQVRSGSEQQLANYLPGPVALAPEVRRALAELPVSHRSEALRADLHATAGLLCALSGARHVQVLMGSGTLANDAIAGQLARLPGAGVVACNGEFGERLVDAARRAGLRFEVVASPWGQALDLPALRRQLDAQPRPAWLWCVHCETSTGVLNPLAALKQECAARGIALALDAVSSLGAQAIDLRGVHLASGVSGKALRACSGLAFVFHERPLAAAPNDLPRSLDLAHCAAHEGIPSTLSSNLLRALQTALLRTDWTAHQQRLAAAGARLRQLCRAAGLELLVPDGLAAPAVLTVVAPADVSSHAVGLRLEAAGTLVSHASTYLVQRNWLQLCLMGEWSDAELPALPGRVLAAYADVRRASLQHSAGRQAPAGRQVDEARGA